MTCPPTPDTGAESLSSPDRDDALPAPARLWAVAILLLLAVAPFVWPATHYFRGDDPISIHDAARVVSEGPRAALGGGSFHRFRPLRLLSLAAVYGLWGAEHPFAYHVVSMLLHAINVLLAWRLLGRLFGRLCSVLPRRLGDWIAWGGAAVFAVHWASAEAVFYISAIGMLWTTMGTLIAALGILDLTEGDAPTWHGHLAHASQGHLAPGKHGESAPSPGDGRHAQAYSLGGVFGTRLVGTIKLLAGLALAVGGGEYCIAAAAPLAACAAWPRRGSGGRVAVRSGLLTLALAGALMVAYLLVQRLRVTSSFDEQYAFDLTALLQLRDNLARFLLPTDLVKEPFSFLLLIGAAPLAALLWPPARRHVLCLRNWLLAAAALGALVPFAPCSMGNPARFLYLACPFFTAWLLAMILLLLEEASPGEKAPSPDSPSASHALPPGKGVLRTADWKNRLRLARCLIVVAMLVILNVVYLTRHAARNRHRGENLRTFVAKVQDLHRQYPDRRLTVCVPITDDEENSLVALQLMGICREEELLKKLPKAPPAPGELRLVVGYHTRDGYTTKLVGAPGEQP